MSAGHETRRGSAESSLEGDRGTVDRRPQTGHGIDPVAAYLFGAAFLHPFSMTAPIIVWCGLWWVLAFGKAEGPPAVSKCRR